MATAKPTTKNERVAKLHQEARADLESAQGLQGAAKAQNAMARTHGAQAAGALYAARHK